MTSETRSEMCRSGMCLATTAYILLVFSLVACALCFVAPFWIEYNDVNASSFFQQLGQKVGQIFTEGGYPLKSAGLWGRCNADKKCFGFWENDYSWEKSLPGINVCWINYPTVNSSGTKFSLILIPRLIQLTHEFFVHGVHEKVSCN